MAAPDRKRIPLLKANRSPLLCNCRGNNLSLAKIEAKTGNPLNAVLAAKTRINAVTAAITNIPIVNEPKLACAT